MVRVSQTDEFEEWYLSLSAKEQALIEARIHRIETFGHFGDCSKIEGTGNAIAELRWKNGIRVYFYRENINSIKLLNGGKKNDQKKDIKKARVLLERYAHFKE